MTEQVMVPDQKFYINGTETDVSMSIGIQVNPPVLLGTVMLHDAEGSVMFASTHVEEVSLEAYEDEGVMPDLNEFAQSSFKLLKERFEEHGAVLIAIPRDVDKSVEDSDED